MSDPWGQPPQQGGHDQQPYDQGQQSYPQPQPQPQPYPQPNQLPNPQPSRQPYPPSYQPSYQQPYQQPYPQGYPQPYQQGGQAGQGSPGGPGGRGGRPAVISGLVALAVVGGALGIYFGTGSGGSHDTAQTASTAGLSPSGSARPSAASGDTPSPPPSAADTQAPSLSAGEASDLLTTNQVCPSFLAIEDPLIDQMGQIQDEADGLRVFGSFQPKFDALAAGTPPGQFRTLIQAVASDLDAIVAYIKANPHMSKPAPAAFDDELDTFQNDADAVDNACDPLGSPTS